MTLSAAAPFAVAHYALDEGSGNAVESVHGYTGVQNGTVGTGTVFSKAARDFTGSVLKYFETADNADLSGGDIDFCVIAQVRFHVVQGASLVSKEDSGNGEYRLYTDVSGNLLKFYCASSGGYGGIDIVAATNLGVPATATNYLVVAWHDATNNQIGISVNGNSETPVSHAGGIFNSATAFRIGLDGAADSLNGSIREVVILRNRFLTPTEIAELYNSGAPIDFADWAATAPLAAGTASLSYSGPVGIALTSTDPTGGTGPYTHQWQRSVDGGAFGDLTNGGGVTGATTGALVDGSVTAGHVYAYRDHQGDSAAGSVFTNTVSPLVLYPGGLLTGGAAGGVGSLLVY
jgi:hypothetical protein